MLALGVRQFYRERSLVWTVVSEGLVRSMGRWEEGGSSVPSFPPNALGPLEPPVERLKVGKLIVEQVNVEGEDNVPESTTSCPPVKENTTTRAIEGEDNVPESTTSCPSAEEGTTTRAITSSRRAYLSWTRTQAASTAPVRGVKVPAYLLLPN
jgi:hypothetical protein